MDWQRPLACGSIVASGLGLLAIAGMNPSFFTSGIAGTITAGVVVVFGVAFTIGAVVMYASDVDSAHLLRVAGWNGLGIVVTVGILALLGWFQSATGGAITAPLLSGAVIVGVSAFAHVLIGFSDVRRIRAQTVARQREKATVLNRIVRHDLKHIGQMLLGYSEQLTETAPTTGEQVASIGEDLARTQAQIKLIETIVETEPEVSPLDVATLIEQRRPDWASIDPAATLSVDVEGDLHVLAGEHLDSALIELVENAIEHGGDPPTVTIRGHEEDGRVHLEIIDNGPGIPEDEQTLITTDLVETQLHHSSGLGLWVAKWVVEYYDGDLTLEERADADGTRVRVSLPAA